MSIIANPLASYRREISLYDASFRDFDPDRYETVRRVFFIVLYNDQPMHN